MSQENCKKCGRPSNTHVSAVGKTENGLHGLNWTAKKGCSGTYKVPRPSK